MPFRVVWNLEAIVSVYDPTALEILEAAMVDKDRIKGSMTDRLKAKDKVEDPKTHFDKPREVVQDKALSHDEKKKALGTWEQDERQLLTASNEGMPGRDEGLQPDDDNRLGEVVRAKEKIGERPKHKPSH